MNRLAPMPPQPNFHFFGLRRSGNHAVLNWMERGGEANGRTIQHFNDIHDLRTPEPKVPQFGDPSMQPEPGTDLAIYSYQDLALGETTSVPFYRDDPHRRRLTVVRDARNVIASRIRMHDDLAERGYNRSVQSFTMPELAEMWTGYACNIIANPDPRHGNVHFPLWFKSRQYRDEVLVALGLGPNNDEGLQDVPDFGFGSSFDKLSYNGRAQEMAVLERWKEHQDRPEYIAAMAVPQVVDLAVEFDKLAA